MKKIVYVLLIVLVLFVVGCERYTSKIGYICEIPRTFDKDPMVFAEVIDWQIYNDVEIVKVKAIGDWAGTNSYFHGQYLKSFRRYREFRKCMPPDQHFLGK